MLTLILRRSTNSKSQQKGGSVSPFCWDFDFVERLKIIKDDTLRQTLPVIATKSITIVRMKFIEFEVIELLIAINIANIAVAVKKLTKTSISSKIFILRIDRFVDR